jgi:pyruvate, water dikinase
MVKIAGSKATNLATVGNTLGLAIPPGFVITAHAFERFLEESGLAASIQEMLADITTDMTREMEIKCQAIQDSILQASVPESLSDEIFVQYAVLEAKTQKTCASPCTAVLSVKIPKPPLPDSISRS